MSDAVRLTFDTLPSLGSGYRRALVDGLMKRKRGPRPDRPQPRIEAAIAGVVVDPARLAAYRATCGFGPGDTVPLTYPHILAAPLHLALLTHPACVVPAAGIIHARNLIVQHGPIVAGQALDLEALVDGTRDVRNGYEIDVVTKASSGGTLLWESVTTAFVRRKSAEAAGAPRPPKGEKPADPAPMAETLPVALPPDQGRRYAKVSGDYNPIHLWPVTAKLMGFPRPIVHGMWSLARCCAALEGRAPAPAARLEVEFKRPVLLPAKAVFGATPCEGGFDYDLRDRDGKKAYLSGKWVAA